MLNSSEFYVVLCVLNYAWAKTEYERYLATENGKPCISYISHPDYPDNINTYQTEEDAKQDLEDILDMEIPDNWSIHDRINLLMVRNSNKYFIVKCRFEDDVLVTLDKPNKALIDRRW